VLTGALLIVIGALWAFIGIPSWRYSAGAVRAARTMSTSRIADGQKGRVELTGKARGLTRTPLGDPVTHMPCLWFQVRTHRRDWSYWFLVTRPQGVTRSSHPFLLDDGTGLCLIEPPHMQTDVTAVKPEVVWTNWMTKHHIWRIQEGDRLFALGRLSRRTRGIKAAGVSVPDDVRWKLRGAGNEESPNLFLGGEEQVIGSLNFQVRTAMFVSLGALFLMVLGLASCAGAFR
jgi:hypothetical protein